MGVGRWNWDLVLGQELVQVGRANVCLAFDCNFNAFCSTSANLHVRFFLDLNADAGCAELQSVSVGREEGGGINLWLTFVRQRSNGGKKNKLSTQDSETFDVNHLSPAALQTVFGKKKKKIE